MRHETAETRGGTRVALMFPLVAAGAAACWVAFGPAPTLMWSTAFFLVVAAVVAEQVEVPVTARVTHTFETPIVVLAAVLGGPLLGLAAGFVAGGFDLDDKVWRRRMAYAGLGGLQGFAAGVIGLLPRADTTSAAMTTAAAFVAVTAVSAGGRALVHWDRRARPILPAVLRGTSVETTEALIAAPFVALLLVAYPQSPALVLATVTSLLAGIVLLHVMRTKHASELSAALSSALTDALTGAPNRLAFADALENEHARIVRGATPGSLFLVDVDRFKTVNDTFGHQTGDAVLVEVVRRLQRAVRRIDLVCRWGGEELAVLAPGVAAPAAVAAFAERLRAAVGAEPVRVGRELVHVTVSVGGAILDGSVDPTQTVGAADRGLYRAKVQRNQVAIEVPDQRPTGERYERPQPVSATSGSGA